LFIKGKLPTEYPRVWREEEERTYYLVSFADRSNVAKPSCGSQT